MKINEKNLFIAVDNKLLSADLKIFLQQRFGQTIYIRSFSDGESCLRNIDEETQIVILDTILDGRNGIDILKEIKVINPATEVIMLTNIEDVAIAIESFRAGAKDYVLKGSGSLKRITALINYIVTTPLRLMVEEFGVKKYLAAFILTFFSVGLVVYSVLQFMN